MLIPLMMPAIYTSALIFGPAFIIALAASVVFLVRFSSFKNWIGGAMIALGIVELSLVPSWVLWVFLVGLSTIIAGAIILAVSLFQLINKREGAGIGLLLAAGGIIMIIFSVGGTFSGFALGLIAFVCGIAGAASLLPEQRRLRIGLVSAASGAILILILIYTKSSALIFFVGLEIMFGGISVGLTGLSCWARNHQGGNAMRLVTRVTYGILAVVIISSALVFSLRATRVLREELYDNWSYETTADTTIRGIITEIHLNYEVDNYDYSYHVFPAIFIVNVTDVTEVGEFVWMNLTEAVDRWVGENMTIAYDEPDFPALSLDQRVEAKGFFDVPIEDTWSYSNKLVIAAEISGSYVKPL